MTSHHATSTTAPSTNSDNTPHHIARVVSADDDEPKAPPPASVAPCANAGSSADAAVTGTRTPIEHDYHVESSVIGTGHHGSVRKCVDRRTGQPRAVKSICKSDPAVRPGGLAREILLLREMQHEHIVRLVDVYEDAEYVHLVTELCTGGELFDRICDRTSRGGRGGVACCAEDEAARTICQVLQAVAHLHDRGVVHRDLKPENVMFATAAADAPVRLIDFGLSRKHDAGREPPMRTVVGTPYYIAPEVLRRRYDKSCDMWSVGVIAYILLCGYPPFNGADDRQTHRAVLRGRYDFIEEDWRGISVEAMDFIHRLLQVQPEERMTVAQALNHPWMVRHTSATDLMTTSEDVLDNSSVEVLYSEAPKIRHPIKYPGSPMRRPTWKVRASMFGL